MRARHATSWLLLFYTLAGWAVDHSAYGQAAHKAIVMAWDGTVPSFVSELLREGKLPNLAAVIAGGALADDVRAAFPSKTAPGFASLMTGAWPRVTGISGNRVPRAPRGQFTILESLPGFSGAPLQAEPIWATAQRAGRKAVVSHIPSFAGEKSEQIARFAGYELIIGRDGIVTRRALQGQAQKPWANPPPSDLAPLEFTFTVGEGNLFGLLIDDPADPQPGYDTAVISDSRDGKEILTRLKAAAAAPGGELFWSPPISVRTSSSRRGNVYLRLFELQPDGSDFFLYHTRPVRALDVANKASPTVRSFVGNGASILYQSGALGRTIANGGNGGAEARYLETMLFAQHQLIETNRWAIENLPWDIFLAYTPFPDEAEHAWRGFLDATLPTYRRELADKLRPFLEEVYRSCDEHLGLFLAKRAPDTVVALISDHGMQGIYKRVALNYALRENGLLVVDGQGRVDLAKTKVIYPSVNNGYLLINSTERKQGIVSAEERDDLTQKVREILLALRDGERAVVTAVIDAGGQNESTSIGGDTGGDIYIELTEGYDFDARVGSRSLITPVEPQGQHGANPEQASMRTLMVFNGPGIRAGQKLKGLRIIDFAPTLAWLLDLPQPKDAAGRVLLEVLNER